MNNNENNNNAMYMEDNSFDNQGIVDNGEQTSLQSDTQQAFKSVGNSALGFGKGIAQGVNSGLAKKNNPGLGVPRKNNNSNNDNINNKKKNDNGLDNKNPAKGQKNDPNTNKNPGQGQKRSGNTGNNAPKDKNPGVKGLGPKDNPLAAGAGLAASKLGLGKKNKDNDEEGGVVAPNLNEIAQKGIKAAWTVAPIQVKIAVLAFSIIPILIIAMILFLAVFGGTTAAVTASTSSTSYCGGADYDLSVLDDQDVFYSYTGAFDVEWAKSTNQYKNFATIETYADEAGFLRSGDAYLIALGSYFGVPDESGKKKLVMGTKYLIKLKDGTEFVGILADAKADDHTTESSQHAQHFEDGSVVEFEMACGDDIEPVAYGFNFSGSYNKSCGGAQDSITAKFSGELESISLLDSSGESCVYDNGEFPIRTEYFSKSDVDKILAAAPGAKGNYYTPGLTYQCVTYAKMRAVEILLTATNISDDYRKKAIAAIGSNRGNGGDWHAGYSSILRKFNNDPTCTKPKAGSIISWDSDNSHGYGHVGIIEAVNGDQVTVTDGYVASHFNTKTYSISKLQTHGGSSYYNYCKGITYLFEYKG